MIIIIVMVLTIFNISNYMFYHVRVPPFELLCDPR